VRVLAKALAWLSKNFALFGKISATRFFYVRYFYYISTVIKHIHTMKVTIDLKFFIPGILALVIAYMTVTSTIDNWISFAGEANAAGFFIMSTMLGVMLLIGAFLPDSKNSK
jgi:hypothetical protein